MKLILPGFIILLIGGVFFWKTVIHKTDISGAPPYLVDDNPPDDWQLDRYAYLRDWKRPEGPAKVALQVGHWKNDEVPEELERLRGNTGSFGGGKAEWEVAYAIARQTASILEEKGVGVELLPATVPLGYWADVFVSIHADGNTNSAVSGFKAAAPRRDMAGNANKLLSLVEEAYQTATNLPKDPNVSRNMRGYYAFAWWRYDHAVHPMTASIILETGFLTNPADRAIIVARPDLAAKGIAEGVIAYLSSANIF